MEILLEVQKHQVWKPKCQSVANHRKATLQRLVKKCTNSKVGGSNEKKLVVGQSPYEYASLFDWTILTCELLELLLGCHLY